MTIVGSTRVFLILGDPIAHLAFFEYPEIAQAVQADPSAVRALLLST